MYFNNMLHNRLVVLAVNEDDSITPSECPPHPTNLQDIVFPDSQLGNKVSNSY